MGSTPRTERRSVQRIPLQGRVTGQYTRVMGNDTVEQEIMGTSKNVSAEGMFVFLEADVAQQSRVELTLELPTHDVFKNKIALRCVGRVIRTEGAGPDGTFGVAVVFDNVEISSSSG